MSSAFDPAACTAGGSRPAATDSGHPPLTTTLVHFLPVRDILSVDPDRKDRTTKDYFDHETSLTRDIAAHGVRNPLKAFAAGAKYQLVAGQTRLNAARRAGLEAVPVILLEGEMTRTRLLLEELSDNNGGRGFAKHVLTEIAAELVQENGWTAAEVCRRTPALKPPTLSKVFSILDRLVAELKAGYDARRIGFRLAYQLSRLPAADQPAVFRAVEHMSVEAAEAHIAVKLGGKPAKRGKQLKLSLPGATIVFTDPTAAKARTALEAALRGVAQIEKLGVPFENLPGLIKP